MVCAHGCTVIHRCSLYTFFIMSKYSGIQIKVLSTLYSLNYFKSRILLSTNTNMHSCRYASNIHIYMCVCVCVFVHMYIFIYIYSYILCGYIRPHRSYSHLSITLSFQLLYECSIHTLQQDH